ncbi:hypothetical protein FPY71_11795 [Aureimonas fodinaquatilis]|uniref:Uncharacterized protein n=1 Tax=Aureimonas fodinaquatilis TaxID=2565783 RepID=A0A5B0DXN9_9HYPH|nr:hypothetical protein [Aureimonas fodinaquatilis]KAA0971118.1 hypothetical protein FPY71_11795 [Aureimonas fodinaquatilis]
MSDNPFEEGKKDHARGLARSACTYDVGTPEFDAWNEGWGEAMSVAAYVSAPAVGESSKKKAEAAPSAKLLGIL